LISTGKEVILLKFLHFQYMAHFSSHLFLSSLLQKIQIQDRIFGLIFGERAQQHNGSQERNDT
jgi:hypothetical protein